MRGDGIGWDWKAGRRREGVGWRVRGVEGGGGKDLEVGEGGGDNTWSG